MEHSSRIFSPPHLHDSARWAGMRIGLLGGSFNPPHEGHVHISQIALRSLALDAVWWLVSPQNPLKSSHDLQPFVRRLQLCEELTAAFPHLVVSDLEQETGFNRTFDTLCMLRCHFPRTEFVFLTGMDNALSFHRWHRWREILKLTATAHIARPPARNLVKSCPLRLLATQEHVLLSKPGMVSLAPGFSYWLLQNRMMEISSTDIRKNII